MTPLRIAIVGLGLIGGSLAFAIRQRWPGTHIAGIDRAAAIDAALKLQACDTGGEALSLAQGADLVVLAAPVRQNINILRELPERLSGETLITDVGSTKRATLEAATLLPERLRFVGGHPLAGAALGGISAARADLFEGRRWILTPTSATRQDDIERLRSFASGLGAIPQTMDAAEHDRLMAYLSHLPQLAGG